MNTKAVNDAVRIKLAWDRSVKKSHELSEALSRIRAKFTSEEYNEYLKRVSVTSGEWL